jgi:ribonuclease P protein component
MFSPAELEKYIETAKFCKFERLRLQSSVNLLFKEGKSFFSYPFKITWLKSESRIFPLRVMFTVARKNFPHAVDRNRIKRLMRETYRKQKQDILQWLVLHNLYIDVAISYTGKNIPEYAETEIFMKTALKKLADETAALLA